MFWRTLNLFFCMCLLYVRTQKLSGDAFEALITQENEEKLKRSASQGSLHSENDNLLSTTTRQESKNRLSFKMVRQTMKVS